MESIMGHIEAKEPVKKAAKAALPEMRQDVQITPPRLQAVKFRIIGTAPYCMMRFSEKAMNMMADKMKAGPSAKGKKVREARDFDADFKNAQYISHDGWVGIPATQFRAAMIRACSLVGFKMTLAKLSFFILADGYDRACAYPLVKIEGEPKPNVQPVRNANGSADLRCRPLWDSWAVNLNIQFDLDQFSLDDIANLLQRAGQQVGIGEGRPNSRESAGWGWGLFSIQATEDK